MKESLFGPEGCDMKMNPVAPMNTFQELSKLQLQKVPAPWNTEHQKKNPNIIAFKKKYQIEPHMVKLQ